MASKLGYTFYPKDWQTNDKVFELNLEQRAVFRELIDLAMINDNKIEFKYSTWSRKLGVEISKLQKIINELIDYDLVTETSEQVFFIPSCEKRLNLKRGGKKGGKKSSKNKLSVKPTPKPTIKPMVKQIEDKENRNKTLKGKKPVSEIEVEPMDEKVKSMSYDEKDFIKNWNEMRNHFLKTPSNLNRLRQEESYLFNTARSDLTKHEFHLALNGLFQQEKIPRDVMWLRPKHFLENIETYLDAQNNKRYKLYA